MICRRYDNVEEMYADLKRGYDEAVKHIPCDHKDCSNYAGMVVVTVVDKTKPASFFSKGRSAQQTKYLFAGSMRSPACSDCSEFRRPNLSSER